jgi:hypothetical protein
VPPGQLGLLIAVAQKAKMPDALKASGKNVKQETANEFCGRESVMEGIKNLG